MVRLRLLRGTRGHQAGPWFQSHYGAIATIALRLGRKRSAGFNPTMVRLRRDRAGGNPLPSLVSIPLWCDCDTESLSNRNRLGIVSIPLWCDCDYKGGAPMPYLRLQSFNPTMVRLRLGPGHWQTSAPPPFQSHYGAIATEEVRRARKAALAFQSHYGAIATHEGVVFNPVGPPFQSHYGAIATYMFEEFFTKFFGFNPTMVRLRRLKARQRKT